MYNHKWSYSSTPTRTENINGVMYCAYCLEPAQQEEDDPRKGNDVWHHCGCDLAKKESELLQKVHEARLIVAEAQRNLDALVLPENKQKIMDMKYKYELCNLKTKYNQK